MKNESGVKPVEYKVLVKPDSTEKKTAGGVYLPDDTHEKHSLAQVKGTLIAMGGSAFKDFVEGDRAALQPGARVYFAKYEGVMIVGADGVDYRLCNDKSIGAVVTDEQAMPVIKTRIPVAKQVA